MNKVILGLVTLFMFSNVSFAEQTAVEKAAVIKNKTADSAAKNYRAAKDKVCETFNEKGECADQKLKHSTQNLKDSTATKAKEIKNKVD